MRRTYSVVLHFVILTFIGDAVFRDPTGDEPGYLSQIVSVVNFHQLPNIHFGCHSPYAIVLPALLNWLLSLFIPRCAEVWLIQRTIQLALVSLFLAVIAQIFFRLAPTRSQGYGRTALYLLLASTLPVFWLSRTVQYNACFFLASFLHLFFLLLALREKRLGYLYAATFLFGLLSAIRIPYAVYFPWMIFVAFRIAKGARPARVPRTLAIGFATIVAGWAYHLFTLFQNLSTTVRPLRTLLFVLARFTARHFELIDLSDRRAYEFHLLWLSDHLFFVWGLTACAALSFIRRRRHRAFDTKAIFYLSCFALGVSSLAYLIPRLNLAAYLGESGVFFLIPVTSYAFDLYGEGEWKQVVSAAFLVIALVFTKGALSRGWSATLDDYLATSTFLPLRAIATSRIVADKTMSGLNNNVFGHHLDAWRNAIKRRSTAQCAELTVVDLSHYSAQLGCRPLNELAYTSPIVSYFWGTPLAKPLVTPFPFLDDEAERFGVLSHRKFLVGIRTHEYGIVGLGFGGGILEKPIMDGIHATLRAAGYTQTTGWPSDIWISP